MIHICKLASGYYAELHAGEQDSWLKISSGCYPTREEAIAVLVKDTAKRRANLEKKLAKITSEIAELDNTTDEIVEK